MTEHGCPSGMEKKTKRRKTDRSEPHVSPVDGAKSAGGLELASSNTSPPVAEADVVQRLELTESNTSPQVAEADGVRSLELTESNTSPQVAEADGVRSLELTESNTSPQVAEADDARILRLASSNTFPQVTKRRPEDQMGFVKPITARPALAVSPTISQAVSLSPTVISSIMLAEFRFFEEKASPEKQETDRPSGVHKEASWQGQKEVALLGPDLIMIFGHGFLQNMALFIATMATFVVLCHNLQMSIMIKEVDYWCKPPPKYSHMTANEWRNISTSRDPNETWDPCFSYEPPLAESSINRSRVPCQSWDYDPEAGRSIIAEWDLVCERHWLVPFQGVMYMSGAIAALPIMGKIADHIGRRPVICMSVLILLASGIAICFTRSFEAFLVLRVLVSASVSTIQIGAFVLLFELSMPGQQSLYSVLSVAIPITTAPVFLWMVSRLVTNWVLMQGLVMVPTSLLICAFQVTTESPRWLVTRGKHKDVEEAILWASRMNGTSIDKAQQQWCMLSDALHKRGADMATRSTSSFADIVSSPTLLRRSVIIFWCWFVIILAFYSHHLRYPSDSVWLLIAKVVLQVPSFFLVYDSIMRLGHKATLHIVLIVLSLFSIFDVLLRSLELHQGLLEMTAKISEVLFDMTVILIYTYSLELFPTVVRNFGICSAYFCGRIGGMLAPLVMTLTATTWTLRAPMVICTCTLIAALAVVFLPDTCEIVDTIKELDKPKREKAMTTLNHREACTSCPTRR